MYSGNKGCKKKRLGIIVIKSATKVLENYCRFYCEKMREELDRFIIICSDKCTFEMKLELNKLGEIEQLCLEGKKYISEIHGLILKKILKKNELDKFDQLVIMSDSLYGPISPVDVMFQEMDRRGKVLWGVFKRTGIIGSKKELPVLLDEQFVVINKELFLTDVFKEYLNSRENIGSFMKKRGYIWDAYLNDSNLWVEDAENYCAHNVYVYDIIKDYKVPFIEREVFGCDIKDQLIFGKAEQPEMVLKYIEENTNYCTEYIWDDILKNNNLRSIYETLHLTRIVDKLCLEEVGKHRWKIAAFLHLFYEDLFKVCITYIKNLPKSTDVYITTDTEEKKNKIYEFTEEILAGYYVKVILVFDRGRELSALLVACRKYLMNYDFICHVQDKRASYLYRPLAESQMRNFFESVIATRNYVENVLTLFEKEPRLGCLIPSQQALGGMGRIAVFQDEWGCNFENIKKMLKKFRINVPVSEKIHPFVYGTIGWFRTQALEQIFTYKWRYEDFEEEPLGLDGCVAHSIERILPYAAQERGYYTAIIMEKQDAQRQLVGLELLYRNKLYTMDMVEQTLQRRLILFCRDYSEIVIYGAGKVASEVTMYMEKYSILFSHYVVKTMKGNPEQLNGHRVMTIDETVKELSGAGWVIAVGRVYVKEVLTDLDMRGIKDIFLL